MNNKLLLQDLTDQLSIAGKIKKKDAEEFLRAFFKVTEDALFQGETIKINGLGTFKLLLVDARKSVNVSTGEEFEIKEHYKLSFTPDSQLKDTVNAPFAHLEPVELEAGTEKKHVAPPSAAEISRPSKKAVMPENQEKGRSEARSFKPGREAEKDHLEAPENQAEAEIIQPDKKRETPDVLLEAPIAEEPKKRSYLWWIVSAVVITCLGIWAWVSNMSERKDYEQKSREIALMDSLEASATHEDSLYETPEENAEQPEETLQTAPEPEKTAPEANVQSKPAIKPKATSAPTEKTATDGTYPITVKLEPGNRLTLLALKYYGHKAFWVYIYEANKKVIKDPDHIPAGTVIRIPKPDPKLVNPNDPACIAKAKAKQSDIMAH